MVGWTRKTFACCWQWSLDIPTHIPSVWQRYCIQTVKLHTLYLNCALHKRDFNIRLLKG